MTEPPPTHRSTMQLAERLSQWTALPMLGSVVASCVLGRGWPLAATGALNLSLILGMLARHNPPRSYLPTFVTCVRAVLTCLLIAMGRELPGLWVALGILSVFTLDGLDGFLARRTNSVSVLGERLDMETDALLVMIACALLWLQDRAGLWVLTSGLLRYAYVVAVWISGRRGEAPRSSLSRYVFGMSLSTLALGFLLEGWLTPLGPMLATAMLLYSFGRSFYWSFRGDTVRVSQSNRMSEPSEK